MDIRIHATHLRSSLLGPLATPLELKPSYSYQWDELDVRTFRSEGVIARRTPEGEPRFNFPQTVWLFPDVRMDWARHANRAVQTLAVNILTNFFPERDMAAYFGTMSRRAFGNALRFAEDFILSMPPGGGHIPREIIERWIAEEF